MAIFGKKEEGKTTEKPVKTGSLKKPVKKAASVDLSDVKIAVGVLIAPHITEKSVALGESVKRGNALGGQYVFRVEGGATKPQVRRAVEDAYKVKVISVKIIARRDKARVVRGRKGKMTGYKKALVILKKGDKIKLV